MELGCSKYSKYKAVTEGKDSQSYKNWWQLTEKNSECGTVGLILPIIIILFSFQTSVNFEIEVSICKKFNEFFSGSQWWCQMHHYLSPDRLGYAAVSFN